MGSFFVTKKQDGQQTQPLNALRVQSAVEGKAIPRLWGQNRLSPNLIWYGDFFSVAIQQGGGGGKGGAVGGGGKGQQGSVTYNYYVSIQLALCEGPVSAVGRAWNDKAIGTSDGFGFEFFDGSYTQTPWGYLTTRHADQAFDYRGLSYLAQSGLSLGSSTELPNYSFEVTGTIANAVPGVVDANPRDVVVDFLTNPYCGIPAWPAGRLASLDAYAQACQAAGLFVSPVLTDQNEASGFLNSLFTGTNASPRWSSGVLDVIPWFDSPITGNGVTYTPDVTPQYDLTNDDLLPGTGSNNTQPILCTRSAPNERLNSMTLEFLDRSDNYDPAVVNDKDQASIQVYGLRPSDVRTAHFFCLSDAARLSAHLQLAREQIPNVYTFTVGARFIRLDVEDIVTLTRPEMSLFRQGVRITEITENPDGSLTMIAEEFNGTVGAPKFGTQATVGYTPNYNVDPGGINDPIIFEPTDQLGSTVAPNGGGLQVWAAVSGVDTDLWGGCNVYASYDGQTYMYLDSVKGPARMGVLTAPLASFPINATGPNLDITNTLKVDVSESGAELLAGTHADALALNTACYVGGEIVAYADATLTALGQYTLGYLVRGAYGTEDAMSLSAHLAGTPFARLDAGVLKIPYDQSRIGSTIYLKFQSFNVWGGGLQDISTLPSYPYVLTGSALFSPLPDVQNLRLVYSDGFTRLWWDDVSDFRSGIRYKIFKGDSFSGAAQVDDVAHAPFNAFGDGVYWVQAYCQPVPGRYAFSENPASETVAGALLVQNAVFFSDQQAEDWPGIFSNGVNKIGTIPTSIIGLGGGGNILTDTDILNTADILNFGGIVAQGTYEVAPSDYVDVGYVADCSVLCTWKNTGGPVGQDILLIPDILNTPDILGSASTQYTSVKVQIATSEQGAPDFFQPIDFFTQADVFSGGILWSDWRDYAPGTYRARHIKFRLVLTTSDANTIAYDLMFTYQVSVPARIDHYPNHNAPSTGVTIVFEPDDASVPAPFNGGPPVGGVSNQRLPSLSFQCTGLGTAGLTPIIDSLTLSALTYHWADASGTAVTVANSSVIAEGY